MNVARKQRCFLLFVTITTMLLSVMSAFAGPSRTTYQAKIIKPDGYPLEAASVNFKFTILDPAGACILYSETYSAVNMASTGGLISFSLGSGVKTYPTSSPTFADVFSNITPSLSCDVGGPVSYSPSSNDIRKIVMQFHDGSGWQTLPAMNINAVPYAMYADDSQKLGGVSATAFVQDTEFPTCIAGEALHYNGTQFTCVASAGTVSAAAVVSALGYTPADGASVTAVTTYAANVSATVFSVSSTVSSLANLVSTLQSSTAASFAAITSSQWVTSGTTISYNSGNVIVSGALKISMDSAACVANLAGSIRYNAGLVEYCNGTSWSAFGVAGAGITLMNGSASGTQTFVTGISGTNFGITTTNGVHTFNIPLAASGSVTAGLLSNADYVSFTNKVSATSASVISALGYTPASATTVSTLAADLNTVSANTAASFAAVAAASANYAVKANNLSDLASATVARTNLGLGSIASLNSIDLGSSQASGTLAEERLADVGAGVTSGTQYTRVTVDGKGRVISGAQLSQSEVTTALGFTPASASVFSASATAYYSAAELNAKFGFNSNSGASYTQTQYVGGDGWQANIAGISGPHVHSLMFNTYDRTNYGDNGFFFSKIPFGGTYKTSGTVLMAIKNNSTVGIGVLNPSARLHLASGTTSLAPIKLSSGALLTSPQSGTIEYDGFYYYITDGANTRRAIATVANPGTFDNVSAISSSGNITLVPTGSVIVSATTASTSSNTGALVVNGGLGVSGSINVSGTVVTASFKFIDGNQASGKVLTSDASGFASWQYPVSATPGWGLTGNAGTSATTNFIGTTDNTDLIFKRNNARAGLIGSTSTSFGNGAYAATSATGSYNSAFGNTALANNSTGYQNTAMGAAALEANTTGASNSGFGNWALRVNNGSYNTAVGETALGSNSSGSYNTALGHQAGHNTGVNLQTNSNSVFVGALANTSVNGLTNVIAVGYQAQATQNNQVVIGNGNITQNIFSGRITTYVNDANSGISVVNTGSTTARYPIIEVSNYASATTGHPVLGMSNSLGTSASPLPLTSGMSLGTLLWTGQVTTSQTMQGARIDAIADGNFANNSAPTRMTFSLAPSSGQYATRMTINSNGHVGVGVASPNAFLHLTGGTSSAASLKLTSGTLLTSPQSGTIEYDGFNYYVTNGAGTRSQIATSNLMNSQDSLNTFGSGHKSVVTGSDANGVVWHVGVSGTQALDINSRYSGGPITMTIGGSEKMRIQGSNGFVGIGTTTPMQKLDVHGYMRSVSGTGGSGNDGGRLYFGLNYTGTTTYDMGHIGGFTHFAGDDGSGAGAAGGIIIATKQTTGATAAAEKMRVSHDGNVGIATTTPNRKLDVKGATDLVTNTDQITSVFHIPNSTSCVGKTSMGNFIDINNSTLSNDGANRLLIGNVRAGCDTGADFVIKAADAGGTLTERMRINENGNMGIGTSAPSARLEVTSANDTSIGLYIGNSVSNGVTGLYFSRWGSASAPMGIQGTISGVGANAITLQAQAGNVGVGTTTPEDKLDVKGTISIGVADATDAQWGEFKITKTNHSENYASFGFSGGTEADTSNNVLEAVAIKRKGNVGIGTINPGARLHIATPVSGGVNNRFVSGNSNSDLVNVTGASGDVYLDHIVSARLQATVSTTVDRAVTFKIDAAPSASGALTITEPLAFWVQTGNSSFGGNVGIGSTSATSRLTVKDTLAITGTSGIQYLLMGNQDSSGSSHPTVIRAANGNLEIGSGDAWTSSIGGTFTPKFYFSDAGSLGIGTNAPASRLSNITNTAVNANPGDQNGTGGNSNSLIWGSAAAGYAAIITNNSLSAGANGLNVRTLGTNNNYVILSAGVGVSSTANSYDVLTVRANRQVGVNTNTPVQTFTVNGMMALQPYTQDHVYMEFYARTATPTTRSGWLGYGGAATTTMALTNELANGHMNFQTAGTGKVGINQPSPSYMLDVNGTLRGYGITDSSDIRLKKDIQPLNLSLEKILQVQGVSYYWKDKKISEKKQIGFIAQQLEKIFPDLVETDNTGMKSVNYSHLIAPLVEAVKSIYSRLTDVEAKQSAQAREIATVKAENAEIKAENEKLKQRLDRLEKLINDKK